MDVSIIIVTYNTRQMTAECIDSVFEKTSGIDFEVILVDNASADGSKEFFEKDQRIRYIYSPENLGFGRANNKGAEVAKGKYLFLLNSDTLLENNAVKEFYDYMEQADSQTACCGCLLVNKDHERIHSFGSFHTLTNAIVEKCWPLDRFKILLKLGKFPKYDNPKFETDQEAFEVPFATGAALVVRKEVSDKYGLFDPDFFMYSEDMDLQHRYFEHGFKSVIIRTPQIIHLFGMSSKKGSVKKIEMNFKSLFLYMKKHYSFGYYTLFSLLFKSLYSISFSVRRSYTLKEKFAHIRFVQKL
ncbi:glycosyltransferase family 2 protein [Fibrobacter sp. UWEL]|uniref:glycosyltransferase family 2 protein n=1 Tax=Fibrobacter sp. UWEL TaxID=1896209 RepID=UPI00091B5B0C|nr:glycosyltransferase family 2 protein [Fibrobacter sp. UWEL]SHK91951.1 hypothetical protein SAMN05720468_10987 [Fibrobacter sp. UWEL]